MKKPYQIESQRAVKRLEEMAADGNPVVQLVPVGEANSPRLVNSFATRT